MIDKEIFKTASNNKDYGHLDNYSHYSNSKSSTCGDNIKIYIQVKNEKIINLKYQGNFCIYCNASASLLAKKSKNKSVKETVNFLKNSNTLFKNQKNLKINKWLSFKKISTSALQSRALAGVACGKYIFCLPGSPSACKDGWDGILKYQLDIRHKPCNFVEIMPRLQEHKFFRSKN